MTEEFVRQIMSNGPSGEAWLKRIPELIKKFEGEWSINVLQPFENLTYGYVAPAVRADGSAAVLKLWYPGDEDAKNEARALTAFGGEGIARLLEVDMGEAAMLLERVLPGSPLSTLHDDEAATRILAAIAKKLHKPLPAVHSFVGIADEYKQGIAGYRKSFGKEGPVSSNLVDKAERFFEELIATSAEAVLVHGDLHQDNILSSEREGWLAIDPKGMVAEPLYETAAMIRNPYATMKNRIDIEDVLRRRIRVLSEELGASAERILRWGFAQTVLSAIWNSEGPKGPEHAIFVAEALDRITI